MGLKETLIRARQGGLRPVHAFALLAFFGALLYAQTIGFPFVHDDHVFIVGNHSLARWDDLGALFLQPSFSLPGQAAAVANVYYRPVLEVVNKVLFFVFHHTAAGYHLFNVLLHILNSFLVYRLVARLSRQELLSLGVALFFLIHPVQTEAVCAVAGISNLLSALLCFLSLFLYLEYKDQLLPHRRAAFLAGALFFFLLALGTKESSVMLALVIVCYEIFFMEPGPPRPRDIRRPLAPAAFVGVLAGYFVFRQFILHQALPDLAKDPGELWLRLTAIPGTLLTDIRILVFPHDLHYYRSVDILRSSVYPSVMLGFLGFLALVFLRSFPFEEKRLALLGLGFFVISLAPTLNVVPLVVEYSLILTPEHFLYIPAAGFFLFVFVLFRRALALIFAKDMKTFAIVIFVIVAGLLALTAKAQSRYWQAETLLFQRTLQYQPGLGRVHLLLAKAYHRAGDHAAAAQEYTKAIRIMQAYCARTKNSAAQEIYLSFMREAQAGLARCDGAPGNSLKMDEGPRQAE